jgi:hypothetical protein
MNDPAADHHAGAPPPSALTRDWARIGLWLVAATMAYNLAEGLVAHAAAGWWWADPLVALLMVPWLVNEGIEGLRGERGDHDGPGRLPSPPL